MPSSSSGSLILPVLIWDNVPPDCTISSILVSESEKYVFTGTTSGHIIMWDLSNDEITPSTLIIGHTSVVNCLARAGLSNDEEYLVSSSENGEMKLWEINEKKCIENIKMANTIHKNIYSSRVNGKFTRLFCVGNYPDVLVIDPMSLDVLYTLVSREQPQWIKALCINTLANKQDDVIVGVSIVGTIKLWTVNANETKGSEVIEHEFRNCQCENANTLASCPGKQRIFIVVCPKFFQIFDAFDFTVLCQLNISSLFTNESASSSDIEFTQGFFLDIENILICTSDGHAYLFSLPENVNPQLPVFRQKLGSPEVGKFFTPRLLYKLANDQVTTTSGLLNNSIIKTFSPPVFYLYKKAGVAAPVGNVSGAGGVASQPVATRYLLRGGAKGVISTWSLNQLQQSTDGVRKPSYEISLKKFWHENFDLDHENFGTISTFLYLPTIDRLVYGMNDGSIIILQAIEFLVKNLFYRNFKKTNMIRLKKHQAKVTCILYPHAEHTRYDPTILVTGSIDFSIILWNINTGDMVHRFVVQSGEILQLSVPPNNVNPRILQCICSIASDHSVALLSLKECKPVMIASRHLFPVSFVKWRPLDDYLIVKCVDGGVFVWQIETGNLDRVAHGLLADDILNAADDLVNNVESFSPNSPASTSLVIPSLSNSPLVSNSHQQANAASFTTPAITSNMNVSNQALGLAHILQKRNFGTAIKNISLKLSAANRDESKKINSVVDSSSINFPLIIQPFHLTSNDPVKHLLLFDVDSLLTTLILEEYAIGSMIKHIKANIYKEIHNIQTAPTQLITPLYRTTPDMSNVALKRNVSSKAFDAIDIKQLSQLKTKIAYAQSTIKLANILLSSLHMWQIDTNLDRVFVDKLDFQKPKFPIAFGRISRGAHLFVPFPPKKYTNTSSSSSSNFTLSATNPFFNDVKFFTPSSNNSNKLTRDPSLNLINFDDSDTSSKPANPPPPPSVKATITSEDIPSPTKEYWIANKIITTEHLLTVLAVSNNFMNLQNFIDLHMKKEESDAIEYILGTNNLVLDERQGVNYSEKQTELKQAYSRLSTMYCMLPDYYQANTLSTFKSLNLETLALKWMDPSYDIREAAQTLLKNELKRMGPSGRSILVKTWEPHLSSLLRDFEDLNQQPTQQQNQAGQAVNPNSNQSITSISSSTNSLDPTQQTSAQTTLTPNPMPQVQATTINQSSVIQDLSNLPPNSHRIRRKQFVAIILLSLIGAEFGQDVNSNKSQTPYKTIPQGFSLEDHSILKRISIALSNLVTNKGLHHDVTRRAAIDLIGRGFSIWEPFIQPTYILLSLLELAADADLYVPKAVVNLPLTPIADACKIGRNSLTLIANSRPKTFILTIVKEIKRMNTTANQSSQSTNIAYPFGMALTRGKPEMLQIIERLIDNQSQDVYELLSEVIEIILFCLDPNMIRSNGFEDCFPAIFKFPMVRYCRETKRIIIGCHNGRLVMYEYKASKWNFQSYPGHNGQPIVAVSIANDSKHAASYSAHDNSLLFWQSSGGSIFNIGSSSLKVIKVCNAAPIDLNMPVNKLASLHWQSKTLNLIYHDSRKFSYQI